MDRRWDVIDSMVAELGDLYALELEAEAFPEVVEQPPVHEVRLAVLRASAEMSRLTGEGRLDDERCLAAAREALDSARGAADAARALLRSARAARIRHD